MPESIAPKPPKSTASIIMESIVDLVAIVALSFLTYAGKVPQWPAIVVIALLAGVRISDLGNLNRPGGPDGPWRRRRCRGHRGSADLRVAVRLARPSWHRLSGFRPKLAFRTIAARSIGLASGGCSAGCVPRRRPCVHRRRNTPPPRAAVWKFTLAEARDSLPRWCAVRRSGRLGDMLQGAA
jgi:hypothetical protein